MIQAGGNAGLFFAHCPQGISHCIIIENVKYISGLKKHADPF